MEQSNQQSEWGIELRPELLKNLQRLGIERPTPIQQELMPLLYKGYDTAAQAPTGSGKTLAYVLPALQKLDPLRAKELQTVILAPTRELVFQIQDVIAALLEGQTVFSSLALAGGADIKRQIERLKSHPQVVVGTPGRLVELIQMRKLSMHHVRMVVIDEMDQMIRLGSAKDMESILKRTLKDCQFAVLSATLSEEAEAYAKFFLKNAHLVRVTSQAASAVPVSHLSVMISEQEKIDSIRKLIRNDLAHSVLIFVNHANQIPYVVSELKQRGFAVEGIQAQTGKQEREAAMKRFRMGKTQILVSTDLAARGLDIRSLTHVIHYGIPHEKDQYLHRSGRVGRVGQSGTGKSVLLVTPSERAAFFLLQKELGIIFTAAEFAKGQLSLDRQSNTERKPASAHAKRNKAGHKPESTGHKPAAASTKPVSANRKSISASTRPITASTRPVSASFRRKHTPSK